MGEGGEIGEGRWKREGDRRGGRRGKVEGGRKERGG